VWKVLFADPQTKHLLMHQCAAGLKGPKGGLVKRPTSLVSNSPALLLPLAAFVCPETHVHEVLEAKAQSCPAWPWQMANAVVDGVIAKRHAPRLSHQFPTVAVGPTDSRADSRTAFSECPACRSHMSKYDARHIRTQGKCRWPDTEQIVWDCQGCKKDKPAAHDLHTYGPDCKHAIIAHRGSTLRKGAHPREPSKRALEVPGAEAQAQLPDGSDLAPAPEAERPDPDPASSSHEMMPQPEEQSRGRGLDREDRHRRVFRDAAVGDAHASDWTRFDITHCLRAFRSQHQPTIIKTLRKVHLRLWHAGVSSMTSLLRNAGVSQEVLNSIPDIIATCKECRMWTARPKDTRPSVQVAMAFNEVVETDLLFYKEFIIQHFVCRASRWHSAIQTPNKTEAQLLENVSTAWVTIFGPMSTLVSDPESGLSTPTAEAHLKRMGIKLKLRGKDQHARYVERRGAILRHALHVADAQAVREGISLPFKELLAQCVFSGNALTHVGGVTPYQVVMGRQPAMLPPITDDPSIDERRDARIREIALQAMIGATSAARVSLALKTPTTLTAEDRFKPDDLVELYRTPANKDSSGWSGPYRVVECRAFDGIAVLKVGGINRPYRIQDIRHAMFITTLLGTTSADVAKRALNCVHQFLESLPPNRIECFGLTDDDWGNQVVTQASRKWPTIARALNYLIRTSLQMYDVCAARLGREVRNLPHKKGTQFNVALNWDMLNPDHVSTHTSDQSKLNVTKVFGSQQEHFAILQCFKLDQARGLLLEDVVDSLPTREPVDQEASSRNPTPHSAASNHRLSTIPEETSSHQISNEAEILFMKHFADSPKEDASLLLELCELAVNEDPSTFDVIPFEPDAAVNFCAESEDPFDPAQFVAHKQREFPDTLERDSVGSFVETFVDPEISQYFMDGLSQNVCLSMKIYLNSDAKKEVISRDTDIMTSEEQVTHKQQVDEAIISEFKTWSKYGCFEIINRKDAQIIIDSRMVLKWKYIDGKRGIRARLALRGFKEPVKDGEQNYAGTAQRLSQRILASTAATHPDWVFGAADVPKAFLQGLTFDELEAETREPRKYIAFTIPKGTLKHLRCVPNFENFNEHQHVLSCLKPGTGCRDAPRAFSLRLMKILRNFGMQSTMYDPQLMLLFKNKELAAMISIHVDDIKFTGRQNDIDRLVKLLEATFGKMTLQFDKFTNCGMTHERDKSGNIVMHQDEYIQAFKPIHPKHYQGYDIDGPCSEHQQALFMSLLGAVAYTSLTQVWILVYIVALQRKNKQASVSDLKRLNALTRELMRNPQKLYYHCMTPTQILEVYSDSAYSREGDTAHALKGMICLRLGRSAEGQECSHLLDALSQSHKLAVRSTFGAELLAATSAVDHAFGIALTLHETEAGCLKPDEALQIRESGGLLIAIKLLIDAMSVYHSIIQESFKAPSEKSLLSHISWLKEMLHLGLLKIIGWVDTRDMAADGLTKGKISRDSLLSCMRGTFSRSNPIEIYPRPKGSG